MKVTWINEMKTISLPVQSQCSWPPGVQIKVVEMNHGHTPRVYFSLETKWWKCFKVCDVHILQDVWSIFFFLSFRDCHIVPLQALTIPFCHWQSLPLLQMGWNVLLGLEHWLSISFMVNVIDLTSICCIWYISRYEQPCWCDDLLNSGLRTPSWLPE